MAKKHDWHRHMRACSAREMAQARQAIQAGLERWQWDKDPLEAWDHRLGVRQEADPGTLLAVLQDLAAQDLGIRIHDDPSAHILAARKVIVGLREYAHTHLHQMVALRWLTPDRNPLASGLVAMIETVEGKQIFAVVDNAPVEQEAQP